MRRWWCVLVAGCTTTKALESPRAVLESWRRARVASMGAEMDVTRYHAQVMFVDDDNVRGKLAEGLVDKLALYGNAGYWIYPHASSVGRVREGQRVDVKVGGRMTRMGLDPARVTSPATRLCRDDLDAYDLIVAVDSSCRDAVLKLSNDRRAYESRVCLLSDFGSNGRTPEGIRLFEGLHDDLRSAALRAAATARFDPASSARLDLTDGVNLDDDPDALRNAAALAAVDAAGLVVFLKRAFDDGFLAAYRNLLRTLFHAPGHLDLAWPLAEDAIRKHQFTGALAPDVRRQLFDDHMRHLHDHYQGPGHSSPASGHQS